MHRNIMTHLYFFLQNRVRIFSFRPVPHSSISLSSVFSSSILIMLSVSNSSFKIVQESGSSERTTLASRVKSKEREPR